MSNRRGQELPFSTIIIFILAILVLVLIIIVYWENISKVIGYLKELVKSSSGNIKNVKP